MTSAAVLRLCARSGARAAAPRGAPRGGGAVRASAAPCGRPRRRRARELLAAYGGEAQAAPATTTTRSGRVNEAVALCRALGDRLREGETLSRLTIPYISAGENAEAEEASRAAIEVLEALPQGRELALAYATQACLRMLSRDNYEAVELGREGGRPRAALGDRDTLASGAQHDRDVICDGGRNRRGIGYLQRSLDVARDERVELHDRDRRSMLGSGLGEMYELERAEHYLREHIAFAEEYDIDAELHRARGSRCVRVYRGRWDDGGALGAARARPARPARSAGSRR